MTPHPQQCKTCQKFKSIKEKGKFNSNIGWCEEKPIFPNDYNFILQIGCASHTPAKSEQEILEDEREQWKKGILKFAEEDPLLLAYSDGYKVGKKEVLDALLDWMLEQGQQP